MKIAVLGSGGREEAIAWKLSLSPRVSHVYSLPGNGGSRCRRSIDPCDFPAIISFCREEKIDLVVPGPEKPFSCGIVDELSKAGLSVVGPDRRASLLESSKGWAKDFMVRHHVATPGFERVKGFDEAKAVIERMNGWLVLKYDGLAAGKGVFVCGTVAEALEALSTITRCFGSDSELVIEERLTGWEVSIIGFIDGKTIRLMLPSQDHKQLLDGDRGPNTGGMGAFCPVAACNDVLMERISRTIVQPTLSGLRQDGLFYRGPIYFGLMVTSEGPQLLEYNARLGDPETQVLMPSLATDLAEVYLACLAGTLDRLQLEFHPGFFVGVVLAARGYPCAVSTGDEIQGLGDDGSEALVFHAGTRRTDDRLVTSGGRVLTVVGHGETLEEARRAAYKAGEQIRFTGVHFRRDIGRRGDKPGSRKTRIAVFISGRGSNMESIAASTRGGVLSDCCEISVILSDRAEAAGIDKAKSLGLPTLIVPSVGRSREDFEREILERLDAFAPDYVVLAGFKRILSPLFVNAFAGRIINIHPADPEAFRGLNGYQWAFDSGLNETFVTVHLVDAGVDTGPILAKCPVDLAGVTSIEEVERRGLKTEHSFYPKVLADHFRSNTAKPGPVRTSNGKD